MSIPYQQACQVGKPNSSMISAEIESKNPQSTDGLVMCLSPKQIPSPNIYQNLTAYQWEGVRTILTNYKDIFSDKPGKTSTA